MHSSERANLLRMVRSSDHDAVSMAKLQLSREGWSITHELRLCPECLKEDRDRFGFAIWHTTHQALGVWVCARHCSPLCGVPPRQRPRGWLTAQDASRLSVTVAASARGLELLSHIAFCSAWIAQQPHLEHEALGSMVRRRLTRLGVVSSEVNTSKAELTAFAQEVWWEACSLPSQHFGRFADTSWVRKTLLFKDYSHPLRWCVLVGATSFLQCLTRPVSPRIEGHISALAITRALAAEYAQAIRELPERSLFSELKTAHRAAAPAELYEAMSSGGSLSDAAVGTGMSSQEVARWLKRDSLLRDHWKSSVAVSKVDVASREIVEFLDAHPGATRQDVLASCLPAVRRLEWYDRSRLEALLPPVVAKYDRQRRLQFT
ncbi:hypothetical protein HNP55_001710 [Paucibacter oligotrophus]|uniref:TniQ protein n=2 Tax=Roseateles oligotrophus TaxID=1769250 RepID=A0A840L5X0_9BURK|nr:hypothetical protein [Roseateles oligotrophus]